MACYCITGATGQDASYLAELLLRKGHEVHGTVRRSSTICTERINHLLYPEEKFKLHYCDLQEGLEGLIYDIKPDFIINLAAQSHVRVSFDQPVYTATVNAIGPLRILEAIRRINPKIKFYQASSCLPAGTKVLARKPFKRIRSGVEQEFLSLIPTNIEDLNVGDEVLSMDLKTSKKEYCKILATGNRIAEDMYTLKFSNGNELRLSGNHPVYVPGKGYIRTDELKENDKVLQYIYNSLWCRCTKGKKNSEIYGEDKAKDISNKQSESQKNSLFEHPWKGKKLKDISEEMYQKSLKNPNLWGNKPSWNTGLTIETDERLRKCGRKISKAQKDLWSNPEYAQRLIKAQRKSFNKQEQKLEALLNEICPGEFAYNGDGRICTIDSKLPDFVNINGKKKLIEFYGDYWHTKLNSIEADQKRIDIFLKNGYETLIIWQSELKKSPELVKEKVQTFLHNPNVEIITISKIIKEDKPEKVYDIEVEKNHNFFAYGILVHNSEMFGLHSPPQNESTPMWPSSPYGAAKLAAYHMTRQYRLGYGMFASNGILFNHESERRGKTFVTAKIAHGVAKIKLGKEKELVLGNLDAKRDWGHSADYMRAIYNIMNHDVADDFCVATGEYYSVKDFVIKAFDYYDMDWKEFVKFSNKYTRPVEVPALLGDPTKIKSVLKWEPKVSFDQLVKGMLDSALEEEQAGHVIIKPFDWEAIGE